MIQPLGAGVPAGGMALSPALALIRPIPLGQRVDLAQAGVPFQIENRSDAAMELSLTASDPRLAGIDGWELGYEAPPDMAWFRIEPAVCVIPPRSRFLASLVVDLPDRADLANRHFCVCAVLAPPAQARIGAGLALCARLLIETEVRPDVTTGGETWSLTPALVEGQGAGVRTLRLRNSSAVARAWRLQPIADVITDPARLPRYAASGTRPALGWSVPEPSTGELAPGASVEIRFSTTIPAGSPGGLHEEIWFVGDPSITGQSGRPEYGFARLHHRLP